MTAANSIDLESDATAIVGSRVIEAPRDLVWSVWADPKHLAKWWGPDGFRTTTSAFDFRPGGVWRFVMHGPDGRDYDNRITFDEIVKPERLRYHHGGGDGVEPVQFRSDVRRSRRQDPGDAARRLPVGRGACARHQGIRRRTAKYKLWRGSMNMSFR